MITYLILLAIFSNLFLFSVAYTFKCNDDESKIPVQRSEMERMPESNGCSKPAFIQVSGEEDFTSCCDLHDSCYATCLMKKTECDKQFGACMKTMCKTTFKEREDTCLQAASVYEMGPQMFGVQGFQESQHEYCTCVDNYDKAKDAYKNLFMNFYTTYTNKTEENAFEIVDKIMTISNDNDNNNNYDNDKNDNNNIKSLLKKCRKIFYSLLKKYPHAIRHNVERAKMTNVPPRITTNEL